MYAVVNQVLLSGSARLRTLVITWSPSLNQIEKMLRLFSNMPEFVAY